MRDKIDLLLESGDNLSKILEKGGDSFITWLYVDTLMPYFAFAVVLACVVFLAYTYSKRPSYYNELTDVSRMLGFDVESDLYIYSANHHKRIKKCLQELKVERDRYKELYNEVKDLHNESNASPPKEISD